MPLDYPTVTPYLYYEDAGAALDWLVNAFGFQERLRMTNDAGRVNHGKPGSGYESPNRRGGRSTAGINVYVDDVDAHYEHAKAAGAKINEEPSDHDFGDFSDRRYIAEDLEGHDWFFSQRLQLLELSR